MNNSTRVKVEIPNAVAARFQTREMFLAYMVGVDLRGVKFYKNKELIVFKTNNLSSIADFLFKED